MESPDGLGWKWPQRPSSSNLHTMGRITSHYSRLMNPHQTWPWILPRKATSTATLSRQFCEHPLNKDCWFLSFQVRILVSLEAWCCFSFPPPPSFFLNAKAAIIMQDNNRLMLRLSHFISFLNTKRYKHASLHLSLSCTQSALPLHKPMHMNITCNPLLHLSVPLCNFKQVQYFKYNFSKM